MIIVIAENIMQTQLSDYYDWKVLVLMEVDSVLEDPLHLVTHDKTSVTKYGRNAVELELYRYYLPTRRLRLKKL